ncbi:hypothetical protein Tdes44962_MAKER03530 [Teratosphaeria destructans]|uniref:Uncharacterized protein n=1 Tax=Teratosphaeria destructans TaxID=418781 RepID=A0A9W7SPU1_9PEZI|nr:hypothetical protein Tdes44962_MAKER03530 [Teratosphaeria destructans]
MPTQRPFLSNFLAAFRAHSQTLPKPSPSISSTATATSTASIWSAAQPPKPTQSSQPVEPAATSPRPITQKSTTYSTTTTTTAAQDRQLQVSLSPLQHTVSPQTHLPRSPSSPGLPVYGPPNKPTQDFPTSSWSSSSSRRRGSDSSDGSGGFREVRTGGEKWFVGGRTAGGEERYYQLRMVKRDRDRSIGAVSADQLSL